MSVSVIGIIPTITTNPCPIRVDNQFFNTMIPAMREDPWMVMGSNNFRLQNKGELARLDRLRGLELENTYASHNDSPALTPASDDENKPEGVTGIRFSPYIGVRPCPFSDEIM